jgi:alpha-N-arabinofuranosidase
LTIGIVNPTKTTYDLALDLKGAAIKGTGQQFQIAGSDTMAYNQPGRKPNVVIEKTKLAGITNKLTVPPLSVSLFRLPVR